MKAALLITTILLISCTEPKYSNIGQEIVDGKVSAIQQGHRGRSSVLPKIWVQNDKKTIEVSIPFAYENKWKVGDSCLLIIEKYKENE
jgi:hypothetical protein